MKKLSVIKKQRRDSRIISKVKGGKDRNNTLIWLKSIDNS